MPNTSIISDLWGRTMAIFSSKQDEDKLRRAEREAYDSMMQQQAAAMAMHPSPWVSNIQAGSITTSKLGSWVGPQEKEKSLDVTVRLRKAENGWIVSEVGSTSVFVAEQLSDAMERVTAIVVEKRLGE